MQQIQKIGRRFGVVAVIGAALACSRPATQPVPSASNTITAQELVATHSATAYDAIRQAYTSRRMERPVFRSEPGPQTLNGPDDRLPLAYVNGAPYGPFSSLRKIPATDVASVQFFDKEQTGLRFGPYPGNERGVIDVIMKD